MGRWTVAGVPARLLWHGSDLTRVPAWRNRLRLAGDWVLAGLAGRDTGQPDLRGGGGDRT